MNKFNTTGGTKMNVVRKRTAADAASQATQAGRAMSFHREQKATHPHWFKE